MTANTSEQENKDTLHGMGTGVQRDVSLVDGHAFPPQLGREVILRVLFLVPLLTLHLPGGAEQDPQGVQLVN